MLATGPMPAEVTNCFEGQPGKYGQDLISSGPYMLKGIDSINISSCKTIKADTAGYDGQTNYDLVRNPNWNPKIDPYSKNYPDAINFTVDASDVDIYNKIEAGQLDMAVSTIPPDVLQKYATDAEPEAVLPPEPGRPHLVPDDEPDPAAVRRHPCPSRR